MESALNTIDKIYARIEVLKQYLVILEGLQNTTLSELEKDPIKRGAIERYLQLSIDSAFALDSFRNMYLY